MALYVGTLCQLVDEIYPGINFLGLNLFWKHKQLKGDLKFAF